MKTVSIPHFLLFVFVVILSYSSPSHSHGHHDFIKCLSLHSPEASPISELIYTPNNSSYSSILNSSIFNLRFNYPSTPKPLIIITLVNESQIPAVVLCSKRNGIQIRTRSGGHDYEGLSYTSHVPFILIDLVKLTEISINLKQKTAWVQTGATLGELYYEISNKTRTLGFPGGICPTVGIGGHASGGGSGPLLRKHALAADHIIDARLIDVNGNILDRKSMGEELFWAIRGGGGASFGVISAWKINLVVVPEIVTIFSITRTLEQNATEIVHQWQYIAPNFPNNLNLEITLQRVNSTQTGEKTIQATFSCLYLGRANKLVEIMEQRFNKLGVQQENCSEVSWIQSVLFFGGYPVDVSPQVLTSRVPLFRVYSKGKSDHVREPISKNGLQGIWKLLYENEEETGSMVLTPYGGRMNEIPQSSIPFPHRAGNLYNIRYLVYWNESSAEMSQQQINWIRRLYSYMEPYVSKSPRAAYLNFRDLDIGVNNVQGNTSYEQASIWGTKYFGDNFNRLVQVKTMVDPGNFFQNEQSIPPFSLSSAGSRVEQYV